MRHRDVTEPFYCGLSLQGLIVMETMGWVNWAYDYPKTDRSKIAVAGNLGGGTLSMFLGALCPQISVLAPSGYPSSFEFIAKKDKKHCHCNILPSIVGRIEMWEVLRLFSSKPLFVFQGNKDALVPLISFIVCLER